jgi:hypothetical protein
MGIRVSESAHEYRVIAVTIGIIKRENIRFITVPPDKQPAISLPASMVRKARSIIGACTKILKLRG